MTYQTLQVRFEQSGGQHDIAFIQIHRPHANNTINGQLIEECLHVLERCRQQANVVVLEGTPEIFCFGADFEALMRQADKPELESQLGPDQLYDLWTTLATGPFVSVAHVRGKTNAGGVGFVAACDLVIADTHAVFSLSELLFGLMPACVLPFLIRKIGFQRSNAMTLSTKPVAVEQAHDWGLVDMYGEKSHLLLGQQLSRLKRLEKTAIERYKNYLGSIVPLINSARESALAANRLVFSDRDNIDKVSRYVTTKKFPWEA